jgi:NAD(P)-dependent dehydrogenase (short-subunit alcohol dehydrogenase family)
MAGLTNLEGRVAVITGGASGIGRGIAEELLSCGAKVVIADIEAEALKTAAAEIGAVGIVTDVSKLESVQTLAAEILSRFGKVDIVCNNAGVGPRAKIESMSIDEWKWMIDVNLWGVIHGTHVFLPHLIANKEGGHIVNTASQAGLAAYASVGAYVVTKFGIVGLSETLALELAQDHPAVGVSILCPGPVRTNIYQSQRNRPATLIKGGFRDIEPNSIVGGNARWMQPRDVGRLVAASIRDGRLYVITHPEMFDTIRARQEAIAAAHLDAFRHGERVAAV